MTDTRPTEPCIGPCIENIPRWMGFRSLYPIAQGDDLVAFVGYETGFGKGWKLCQIKLANKFSEFNFQGAQLGEGHRVYGKKENALERLRQLRSPTAFKSLSQLKADVLEAHAQEIVAARKALLGYESQHQVARVERAVLARLNTDALSADEQVVFDDICRKADTTVSYLENLIEQRRKSVSELEASVIRSN